MVQKYKQLALEFEKNKYTPVIYMTIAGLSFNFMNITTKNLHKQIHILQIVLYMHFFRICINTIFLKVAQIPAYYKSNEVFKLLMLRSTIGMLGMLGVFIGLTLINLSDATVLIQTSPIWGVLMASYFLNEKMCKHGVTSIVISFIGIFLIVKPQFLFSSSSSEEESEETDANAQKQKQMYSLGTILCVSASFAIASIMIILRKLIKYNIHNSIQMHYMSFVGTFVAGILIIINQIFDPNEKNQIYITPEILGKGFLVGFFAWFGQFFQSRAVSLDKVSNVAVFCYLQVLFGFMSDVFIFHNDISIISIIGSVLIIGASINIIVAKNKQKKIDQQKQMEEQELQQQDQEKMLAK